MSVANDFELSLDAAVESDGSEEWVNTVTHGLGLILGVLAAAHLTFVAWGATPALRNACLAYAASMVAVYAASTLSHAIRNPPLKHIWRCWDQGCIYLFIAGTYTPFAAAHFPSAWHAPFFAGLWSVAILGFLSKTWLRHRVDAVAKSLYLMLGWIPAMLFLPVVSSMAFGELAWTFAAGFAYTLGTVFLALDQKFSYFHAVWHLLVILGTAGHYAAVVGYVVVS